MNITMSSLRVLINRLKPKMMKESQSIRIWQRGTTKHIYRWKFNWVFLRRRMLVLLVYRLPSLGRTPTNRYLKRCNLYQIPLPFWAHERTVVFWPSLTQLSGLLAAPDLYLTVRIVTEERLSSFLFVRDLLHNRWTILNPKFPVKVFNVCLLYSMISIGYIMLSTGYDNHG